MAVGAEVIRIVAPRRRVESRFGGAAMLTGRETSMATFCRVCDKRSSQDLARFLGSFDLQVWTRIGAMNRRAPAAAAILAAVSSGFQPGGKMPPDTAGTGCLPLPRGSWGAALVSRPRIGAMNRGGAKFVVPPLAGWERAGRLKAELRTGGSSKEGILPAAVGETVLPSCRCSTDCRCGTPTRPAEACASVESSVLRPAHSSDGLGALVPLGSLCPGKQGQQAGARRGASPQLDPPSENLFALPITLP